MPPRRRKDPAAAGSDPPEDPPQTRTATISNRFTPLASKHMTSYGSPAPVLPLRDTGKYGADLKGATRDLFAAVRKDNKQRKEERAKALGKAAGDDENDEGEEKDDDEEEVDLLKQKHEANDAAKRQQAEAAKAEQERARKAREAEIEAQRQQAEARRQQRLEEERKAKAQAIAEESRRQQLQQRTSLPPLPTVPGQSDPLPQLAPQTEQNAPARQRKRAASEGVPSTSPKRAKVAPTPTSSAARSFIEESNLFREAQVNTPAGSSTMGETPSKPAGRGGTSKAQLPPILEETRSGLLALNPPQQVAKSGLFGSGPSRQGAAEKNANPLSGLKSLPRKFLQTTPTRRTGTSASVADDEDEEEEGEAAAPERSKSSRSQLTSQARPPVHLAEEEEEEEQDPPVLSSSQQRRQSRHRDERERRRQRGNGAIMVDPTKSGFAQVLHMARKVFGPVSKVFQWLSYFLVAIVALRGWYSLGAANVEGSRLGPGFGWHGWSDWRHNIGQFVPNTLSHPLGCVTDDEYNNLWSSVRNSGQDIRKLEKDTKSVTKKLETILPRMISVKQDQRTNKLVIEQEFWHALLDRIHSEKTILTLDKMRDGARDISDLHWATLLERFKKRGLPTTTREVEGIVDRVISTSWEAWFRNNQKKVSEILGTPSGQALPSGAEDSILSQVDKIVNTKLSAKGLKDFVVTRDEFIGEVHKGINAHREEVRQEMAALQVHIRGLVEVAAKSSQTAGLSRSEVISLVKEVVRKAVSDAKLQGAAKGTIGNNFETEFGQKVNYFAFGNGLDIDFKYTSPTIVFPSGGRSAIPSKNGKLKTEQFSKETLIALSPWQDPGECWCAGGRQKDNTTRPADLVVNLFRSIIPEDLVVEHIDPAATVDPGAMPKDIELWAQVDELSRRKVGYDFMMAHFPDTRPDHPLIAKGFLKIGAFTYRPEMAPRGIQVFRVSAELTNIDLMSDKILVRAVTNYGADHTCFYRLRLYGKERDLMEDATTA